MLTFQKTDSTNPDFQALVAQLDQYLGVRNGEDNSFFAQYNQLDSIKHVIVAYFDEQPVGCGAFKKYDNNTVEIKRMYVLPEMRGHGLATQILTHLEQWAVEEGFSACVLETLQEMTDATQLYAKCGYQIIPNYGQYIDSPRSVCMKKDL